jgi:hypothetical protein
MTLSGEITNFDPDTDIYYLTVYFNFKDSSGKVPIMNSAIKENSAGSLEIEFSLTAIPDESGKFSNTFTIRPVAFSEGDYTVKATYGGLSASQIFSIVNEKSSDVFTPSTIIEKVNRISDNLVSITTEEKMIETQPVKPRVLSGSMIAVDKDSQSVVNLQVVSESGICIIGPDADCLVSESTRKPGQIFDVVQVDGLDLNVRYSGPDVRLEKFSILPKSSDEFLPNVNWNVEVIKNDEISRLYYKITYKTLE